MSVEKGLYEIRIYNRRHNMNPEYIEGDVDVRTRIVCKSVEKLFEAWKMLLDENEGESYSVWKGPELLISGAYDPGDMDIIMENLGMT